MSESVLRTSRLGHTVRHNEQYPDGTIDKGRSSLMFILGELDPAAIVSSNQSMYTEIEYMYSQRTCVRVLERCH